MEYFCPEKVCYIVANINTRQKYFAVYFLLTNCCVCDKENFRILTGHDSGISKRSNDAEVSQ